MSIFDTVYLHDTIYVTTEGIDGVDGVSAKIYQRGERLPGTRGHRLGTAHRRDEMRIEN